VIAMLAAAFGVCAAVGTALAAIPDSNSGVITACYNTAGIAPGTFGRQPGSYLRVIDAEAGQTCASNETTLALNRAATTVVQQTITIPAGVGQVGRNFAVCPAGTRVTGGGVGQPGGVSNAVVTNSGPVAAFPNNNFAATVTGSIPQIWFAALQNQTAAAQTGFVFAICG
jgi:hypothetical protein